MTDCLWYILFFHLDWMTLISSQTQIKKKNHVATIAKVNMEYAIIMSVMLTGTTSTAWHNVLHATTGVNAAYYGSRIPAVWITYNKGSMKFRADSAVNNDRKYSYVSPEISKELNTWFTIKISQVKSSNEYKYKIELDGKEMHQVKNTHPKEFQNVKVYVSDPWHRETPGYVRNLFIKGNTLYRLCY